MKEVKLVATDLDGTFLRDDKSICTEDLQMLQKLGDQKIVRVAATGRNLEKVREVIPAHVPFDYIAFSSGAGIYDWKNNQLIYRKNLNVDTANSIVRKLLSRDVSFHVFRQVPHNYRCWYYKGADDCEEFERYSDFHQSVSELLPKSNKLEEDVCQFLVIFPSNPDLFHQFKDELEASFKGIRVVRASSPLGTGYIWMEIFHEDVSKANAVRFLCDHTKVSHQATFGIGNDYNDMDLLEFTSLSYLVSNAPDELKQYFKSAPSNQECAFSSSLKNHL